MKSVFILQCLCIYAVLLVHYAGMCMGFFCFMHNDLGIEYYFSFRTNQLKLFCSFQLLYVIALQNVLYVITVRLGRSGQMAPGA